MSTTTANTSLKCRIFLGTSITMPAMLRVTRVKASRRAESVGSQEVTTDNANQSNVAIKNRPHKKHQPGRLVSQAPSCEHNEKQQIADLVGEIACLRNLRRLGEARKWPKREPQQQKYRGQDNCCG